MCEISVVIPVKQVAPENGYDFYLSATSTYKAGFYKVNFRNTTMDISRSKYRSFILKVLSMVGIDLSEVLLNPKRYEGKPFVELFDENSITFDAKVSEKISKDFYHNSTLADSLLSKEDRSIYTEMYKTFLMAADINGVVVYS